MVNGEGEAAEEKRESLKLRFVNMGCWEGSVVKCSEQCYIINNV